MAIDYDKYIQSPEWKRRRVDILRRDKYRCRVCREGDRLDVHHLNYDRLGKERNSDLASLCRQCHDAVHGKPYFTFLLYCQTCRQAGVTISSPDTGWIRMTCYDGHMRERRL